MNMRYDLGAISNTELLAGLEKLVKEFNEATADLLAHIAEVDRRKLYLDHACSSMFTYCTRVLKLSEQAAYRRIRVARAARQFPEIFSVIARGDNYLSGLSVLAPHLRDDNLDELLAATRHRSKREVEEIVADRFPKPDARALVRRLPGTKVNQVDEGADDNVAFEKSLMTATEPANLHPTTPVSGGEVAATPLPRPGDHKATRIEPLGRERYRIQLTAGRTLKDKLAEAQALLRHQVPDGDIATILEKALDILLAETKRRKFATRQRPRRPRSPEKQGTVKRRTRHIPNEVKRRVFERDGARCTFIDARGNRCGESGFLEFHHEQPYARGGDHDLSNVRLVCAAHNQHAAQRDFGSAFMARSRHRGKADSPHPGPRTIPGNS